jgi:dihydroneopterin aldolase
MSAVMSAAAAHEAPAADRIVLRRVAMSARIGVHDWETAEPQPVVLDLDYDLPHDRASRSDQLDDTVDYAAVIEALRRLAMERPHRLVEAMACSMCEMLLQDFGLPRVRLTLMKLAPFPGAEVGTVMERTQPGARADIVPLPSRKRP